MLTDSKTDWTLLANEELSSDYKKKYINQAGTRSFVDNSDNSTF